MPLANDIIKSIRKVVGKQKHHLHEPLFYGNEIKYLKKTITTNLVSSVGPFVKKFEDQIKKFTKSKYAISVVNGTEALHLSLVACGVKNNDDEIYTLELKPFEFPSSDRVEKSIFYLNKSIEYYNLL